MLKADPHVILGTKQLREVASAGGVVIDERNKVLFCHPTNSRWNNWRMPKGLVLLDEDLHKAALREVLEETGYKCIIISELISPIRYRSRDEEGSVWKTVVMFLMKPLSKVSEPDWENDKFVWVEFEEVSKYAAKTELPLILEAVNIHLKNV